VISQYNIYTLPKVYGDIFGFEFNSLDYLIGVYMRCAPASKYTNAFNCGLNMPILGLDRRYTESTQIVEGHNLEHASRQSQNK